MSNNDTTYLLIKKPDGRETKIPVGLPEHYDLGHRTALRMQHMNAVLRGFATSIDPESKVYLHIKSKANDTE